MKKFFIILSALIMATVFGGCLNLDVILPFSNKPPVITSDPIITATEDQLYSYQVEAIDPNGDTLIYSFTIKPEGMSIDSENGLIIWTPTNGQVGINLVEVEISDGRESDTQSFEIEVINVNNFPQIFSYSPTNINIKINEGSSVEFEIQARDIDLNTILGYQWLLNGKKVSSSTGSGNDSKSSWTYSADYGDYSQKIVKVVVSDGELEVSIQWNVVIADIIPPAQPTLNSITSPTNISSQALSGTKEVSTSIWINGVEVVPLDSSVNWLYYYNLVEGTNNISITSRDASGNESSSVSTIIVLDTGAPAAPTLGAVVSPTNVTPQILSGTKEANSSIWINGTEVISINSSTNWSFSHNLSEGANNISITSRDTISNESAAVTATIEYDLDTYVDIGNTSVIEDGTQTHPFDAITEGINAVAPGKSVIVAAGTYNEQLIINKEITLQGASQVNTFITGSSLTENLISLAADNITISGFTIDGASSTAIGIYFDNCSSININNNTIQKNVSYGINYSNSSPTIENNNINNNNYSGIDAGTGGAGIIRGNSLIFNQYGIRTCGNSSPEIIQNNISNNSNTGIYCRESATPIISYNTISNNTGYGILIDNARGNLVNPDIGGGDGQSDGQNKIVGNSSYGVNNKTTHNIYAKYNWWGDSAGPKYPYHVSSSGDWAYWSGAGSEIIFTPHLTTEP